MEETAPSSSWWWFGTHWQSRCAEITGHFWGSALGPADQTKCQCGIAEATVPVQRKAKMFTSPPRPISQIPEQVTFSWQDNRVLSALILPPNSLPEANQCYLISYFPIVLAARSSLTKKVILFSQLILQCWMDWAQDHVHNRQVQPRSYIPSKERNWNNLFS